MVGAGKGTLMGTLEEATGLGGAQKSFTTTTSGGEYASQGTCAACGKEIKGQAININKKVYHSNCFSCVGCGEKFAQTGNKDISESQGKLFCGKCVSKQQVATDDPPCPGCNKAIVGSFLKSCGKEWHKECLKCTKCSKPLAGQAVNNKAGTPYCADC